VNQNKKNSYPGVIFQPQVGEGMQAGFDQLINAIRPTLGPLPRFVAIERATNRNQVPEILNSGGTIARRIIQIPDRSEDVGLMYLRHILWKQQETEGDGTGTAAVLFQSIFNQGRRYVAAGGNAMRLRSFFENGAQFILSELNKQTVHLHGKKALAGLANTICHDIELAEKLGEIFDIIGPYGRLEVRKSHGREIYCEYVEGTYWDGGYRSREMVNDDYRIRANLEDAAVLMTDFEIENPEQLIPLLHLAIENNLKQILLISNTMSDRAISILLARPNREKVFVVGVKLPGMTFDTQRNALEDMAILTGGKAMQNATGDTLEKIHLSDLGRARRIWVDKDYFGIVGGQGNARVLREHITNLRQAFRKAEDPDNRNTLLDRLGKLTGGSATLYIGGISPIEIEPRVELAKHTADALRGALRDGVFPGGGVALLDCRASVREKLEKADSEDEDIVYRILLNALEAPFRTIVENAGYNPERVIAQIENKGPGFGFDVIAQKPRFMNEAEIFDAASVVKGAVIQAIYGAALALTTDVIVHHRNPAESFNP
jgi:chaperonin GroEL